jgi:hypothetical protein
MQHGYQIQVDQFGSFGDGVVKDRGAHGRLHAGLTREVDVQFGRGQPEVSHQVRGQHGLENE